MAGELCVAASKAATIALKLSSGAADAISFVADLSEELPILSPVLKTLTAIREKVETVKHNRGELKALEGRCTYVAAFVVVKLKENHSSHMDVTPLEDCIKDVGEVVERCSRRGRFSRAVHASSDKADIAELNARIDRVAGDLGLASTAILQRKVDELKEKLESMGTEQRSILDHLRVSPTKLAKVPRGTPVRKSWHVERHGVTDAVLKALTSDRRQRLVGLVGGSGSGKTTAASAIVRRDDVRETFSDGIVWLSVNEGANTRLPALMLELANMVYEDVGGSVGRRPDASEDGAAYVKQRMAAGEGSKCLVVADNVWEQEVVAKLLETGMWVLLSTRDEQLVAGADGKAVGVAELSEADAESVLRTAAELPAEIRLPDDAVDLIELCGRVVMDLAFVGRWSTVRGRQDRLAWSEAASTVRAAMDTVATDPGGDRRRKAILQAGFEDLAIGSDDERVQRLYLSLAVMPDSRAFTVKDAAILLYDREPSPEDETSVRGALDILERWAIVRATEGVYRMHDAHSNFAREKLMDRGYVRRPALQRWIKHISSLDSLRSIDTYDLKGLWLAVECVGGDGWDATRPYEAALAEMDESDPSLRTYTQQLGHFQDVQEDWEGASTTLRHLLEVEKRERGSDHPSIVNIYRDLAEWADRLGKAEEAAKWREKEREQLPLALSRMQLQLDTFGVDQEEDLDDIFGTFEQQCRLEPEDSSTIERLLRRFLAIREANLGPEDMQVAHALSRLGNCVQKAGRLEEAEALFRRSLVIKEAKLGLADMEVACTLNALGSCVETAGRLEEAEPLLRRCLTIMEAKLGPKNLTVACMLHNLGGCVQKTGRLEEAEELLRRSIAMMEANLGPEHVHVSNTLTQLGDCLRDAKQLEEAEQMLRRSLATQETKLGPDNLSVANTLSPLGLCLRATGRLEEAEPLLRRCLAIREVKLGLRDKQVASTLDELGICVREAGRPKEAEILLRRSLAIQKHLPRCTS